MRSSSQTQALSNSISRIESMLDNGLYDLAYDFVEKLKSKWPNSCDLIVLEGRILLALERWETLATESVKNLKEFPNCLELYTQATAGLEVLEEYEKIRQLWTSAPSDIHHSLDCHYNLAQCEVRLGYFSSACYHIRKAIAINPSMKEVMTDNPQLMPFIESPDRN